MQGVDCANRSAKASIKINVKKAQNFKPNAKYTLDTRVGYVEFGGKPAELTKTAYQHE